MFIKVRKPRIEQKTISDLHFNMYECRRYSTHVEMTRATPDTKSQPVLILELEDKDDSISLKFIQSWPVIIYVMNNSGKTIDSIYWPYRDLPKTEDTKLIRE